MKILTKLIVALLLTSFLILSALFAVMQWSFDRGMLDYVNQKELASLQLFSENLARFYRQEKTWQPLLAKKPPRPREEHRPIEQRRQRTRLPAHAPNAPAHGKPQSNRDSHKPKRSPVSALWLELLNLSEQGVQLPDDVALYLKNEWFSVAIDLPNSTTGEPRRFGPRMPRHPKPNGDFSLPPEEQYGGLKPTLLDINKDILIGRFDQNFSVKSIELDGDIVGYLALPPTKHLSDAFDLAFIEETQKNLLYIFMVLFALIIIIALPLSRHFIMPIKRLERAMRLLNKGDFNVKLNVKGKDELASLSLNFNDLAESLAQNSTSRKRWLADISHELRTPIAIIKGEIEAIEDGIRAFDQQSLTSLSEETIHLQKLVNDLAELSNAEIGAISYDKTNLDLTALVKQNILRHQTKANAAGLSLLTEIKAKNLMVWADETRINQLFDNLINNSIKYTDAPGEIVITLSKEHNQAIIIINDTLPNVPNASLNKLFEHLYRVESSRNRKTGGSGLGLALCKNIVHAHQGEITASASSYGGLSICCTLPLINS
jgi:two-component system sensor histidine kinase BaeS